VGKISRIIELMSLPGAPRAAISWRKFSLAAYQIISRLKQADVFPLAIIDVGANVGQFSVAANNLMPQATIYPIEPDPKTAELLRKNVSPRVAANIIVSAVGERVGTVSFQVNSDSQVSSVLPLGEDRKKSFPVSTVQESIIVPISTLDVLFEGKSLAQPALLKIDVQGYEDKVIEGARGMLKSLRWVLMEVSFAKLYDGEKDFTFIMTLMGDNGFKFVRPMNFHFSTVTGEIIEMDALFERMV
jgi:FkbM family methyltransferase